MEPLRLIGDGLTQEETIDPGIGHFKRRRHLSRIPGFGSRVCRKVQEDCEGGRESLLGPSRGARGAFQMVSCSLEQMAQPCSRTQESAL